MLLNYALKIDYSANTKPSADVLDCFGEITDSLLTDMQKNLHCNWLRLLHHVLCMGRYACCPGLHCVVHMASYTTECCVHCHNSLFYVVIRLYVIDTIISLARFLRTVDQTPN